MYVRWGRTTCHGRHTELVYKGNTLFTVLLGVQSITYTLICINSYSFEANDIAVLITSYILNLSKEVHGTEQRGT